MRRVRLSGAGRLGALTLVGLLLIQSIGCAAAAQPRAAIGRFALVIGNAAYPAAPLPTATNDAGLIAQSLAQQGFDVTAAADVDASTLRRTVAAFADKLRASGPQSVAFVYVSGYGLQYAGESFYVPVDADIPRQDDVPKQAVPLRELFAPIEAQGLRAQILVGDLARATPFAKADASPLAAGLVLPNPPRGSLYALNATPGLTAPGDIPPYGLYARALAEMIRVPHLSLDALFTRVRLRVAEMSNGAIVPWASSAASDDLSLLGPDPGLLVGVSKGDPAHLPADAAFWAAIAADERSAYESFVRTFPSDPRAPLVRTLLALRLETETWTESLRANTPAAYWSYMERYPRGPHYVDVRRRLAALKVSLTPPPRYEPFDFGFLPPPDPEERRRAEAPPASLPMGSASLAPVPDSLLPPPAPAIYLELAPPPLVPCGALPVPVPFSIGAVRAALDVPGRIVQPYAPRLGTVTIQSGLLANAAAMSLSTETGLVTRTLTSGDRDQRSIVESDAADEVLSRIEINRRPDQSLTIAQSGTSGAPLLQVTTRIDPLGQSETITTNGANQLIASVGRTARGTQTSLKRGTVGFDASCFALPSQVDQPAKPLAP